MQGPLCFAGFEPKKKNYGAAHTGPPACAFCGFSFARRPVIKEAKDRQRYSVPIIIDLSRKTGTEGPFSTSGIIFIN
jgi:hypothetical protein